MHAARSLGASLGGAIGLLLAAASRALADSPAPTQAAIGDPRGGQAAGFAGNPGFAIAVVALIAIVAVAGTLAWVRATGGPAKPDEAPRNR
ncbi:MAG: hypothetical protein U0838_07570 [Chloroflexota bacterium]